MYTHGPAGQSYTVDLFYAPTVLSIVSSLSNGTVLTVRTASAIAKNAQVPSSGLCGTYRHRACSVLETILIFLQLLPLKLNGGNYSGAR
jgi:hypothetical protein